MHGGMVAEQGINVQKLHAYRMEVHYALDHHRLYVAECGHMQNHCTEVAGGYGPPGERDFVEACLISNPFRGISQITAKD